MKTGKASKIIKKKRFLHLFVIFKILLSLPFFMFFKIFQLIPPVLLTPTNYCFHNWVIPPPDRLGVASQTFTKLDLMYSDFVV